jgi:uncharacterized protein YndB with AHSA1/START domain
MQLITVLGGKKMKKAALCALLILLSAALVNAADKSSQPTTDKVLLLCITIPAPRSEVWHAFTTSEGLSTWLTPGAVVDLRQGGEWTAHYPGGKTGGGTIISFVPEKEIVISAMAPEQFPTVRATRTHARFSFEHLFAGNAYLLATLHRRFVNGPIDWAKEWGAGK